MIRNFVTGIVVGGVVAGLGLGVVSQLAPMPGAPAVAANSSEPVVVAGAAAPAAETAKSAPEVVKPETAAPVLPEPAATEAPPPAASDPASVDVPPAESAPAVAAAPTDSIAVEPAPVEPAAAESAAAAPAEPAQPKAAEPTESTATPAAEAPAPDAGKTEPAAAAAQAADPAPSAPDAAKTDAAVPEAAPEAALPDAPPPEVSPDSPAALTPPASAAQQPALATQGDNAPKAAGLDGLPASDTADTAPAAADLPPPAVPETKETLLTPAPEAEKSASPAEITLDPAPRVEPAPAPDKPRVIDTSKPEVLAPAGGLSKTVDGVTTGRLPTIEATPPAAADAAAEAAAPATPTDTRPLVRYARSFENTAGKPMFALLLLDSGAADVDRAKLAALPFPVTFVIDPLDPGAAAASAIYRAAGQEVVMLASGIPTGATAADLEQSFQANAAVLPEAVAVMDPGTGGFQDDRPLATQVVPVIKDEGRGLLTFDRGLNAADQVARRDGVASARIFRDLDAEGEDAPLIRRYLDRAAFKAAQEGRVVVLGTTRPETIAAIMEWTVEGRASSVALAPVTAVMAAQ